MDTAMRAVERVTATSRAMAIRGDVVAEAGVVGRVAELSLDSNVVVRELAHLRIVDAEDLGRVVRAETETRDEVHHPEDDGGDDERVRHACDGVGGLVAELNPVVVEPATTDDAEGVVGGDTLLGKEAGQEVTDNTSNGVRSEDLAQESVIVV
jgi:hypothetical protein